MPLLLSALGLALVTLAQPAHAEPQRWAVIGGWDVGFYPATQGCLAFAAFDDTAFFIGFDTRDAVEALDITVLDERWESIEPDARYPVTLAFGDEPPWTLEMRGVHMDGAPGLNILIDADMDKSATFIEEFQREMRMTWAYGDTRLGQFTLRGSRQAFNAVRDCQRSHEREAKIRALVAPVETLAQ